jgi:hypothetical protein
MSAATCCSKIVVGVTFLRTHVQFSEEHNTAFLAVKYATIAAALVNYIVSDPFEPSMHHSAFMRFRD